jgi:hypothetical protein
MLNEPAGRIVRLLPRNFQAESLKTTSSWGSFRNMRPVFPFLKTENTLAERTSPRGGLRV